jgi:Zn-dependent peptidase ImmA (M78 family)
MNRKNLEDKADQILRETDTYRVPVPIDVVAHRLNLKTEAAPLGGNIAGMLVVEGNKGAIGYNSTHALVRQRFTIAHELAHFLLHIRKKQDSQLFIDRHMTYRRDGYSSGGIDFQEIEANQLGAALLMPQSLVQQEVKKDDLDLDDEDAIAMLAKKFHVSTTAMTNRLTNLRMLC